MIRRIRQTLREAGLYQAGSSGRLGRIGATCIRDCGGYIVVIPRAGVGHATSRDAVLAALVSAGFDARESGTGRNTSGEYDVIVFGS